MKNAIMKFNIIALVVMVSLQSVAEVDSPSKKAAPSLVATKVMKVPDTLKVQAIQKTLKIEINRTMGNVNGGGGMSAADANGQRRLLDLIETDELEYFYPDLRELDFTNEKLVINKRMAGSFWLGSLGYSLSSGDQTQFGGPRFMWDLLQVLTPEGKTINCVDLGFNEGSVNCERAMGKYPKITPLKWALVDGDLENINDEGDVRIINENTKKQLAVQKNGLVIISRSELQKLDATSVNALFIHEAVLRVVLELNPADIAKNGTLNVRAYTRRFVNYLLDPASTPTYPIREAYDAFGIVEPTKD